MKFSEDFRREVITKERAAWLAKIVGRKRKKIVKEY